jgi:histidinol-phosphatase (PHP family)
LTPSDLETIYASFLEEAHRLRAVYSSKIALLVGIETDFITPRDLEGLSRLLERESARIDYIVGSLHHVNEIPIDFDKLTFDRALASLAEEGEDASSSMTRLLHTYLDSQHALLATVQPEVIGHFDLIRLYHPTLSLKAHPGVWAKVERNVRLGVEYGALFELNAAAFRKGWDEAYPAWDVLEVGRSCSVVLSLLC